jgi:hypothetical protein
MEKLPRRYCSRGDISFKFIYAKKGVDIHWLNLEIFGGKTSSASPQASSCD